MRSGEEGSHLKARRLTGSQWAWLATGIFIGIAALYLILLYVDGAKLAAGKIEYIDKPKILLDAQLVNDNRFDLLYDFFFSHN